MTCFCATTHHQHPQFQEGLFSERTLSETISTRSPKDLTAISRTTLATITRRTQRTKSTALGGEKFNVRDRMKRNILVHLIVRMITSAFLWDIAYTQMIVQILTAYITVPTFDKSRDQYAINKIY